MTLIMLLEDGSLVNLALMVMADKDGETGKYRIIFMNNQHKYISRNDFIKINGRKTI